ncbi:MAG: anthranilate synthase component I [Candidatus Aquicultor primus]|uniref:Anthranilate synthase component 1 n=1 Tax=Candidatus Aquicultor primus TaxID=1797195 RepID=A0A1F2UJD2_9ACTN|nr:MAG: anthranilate synthase component I [Candidatus Aquicultor primus]
MYTPSRSDFKKLAEDYNVIPVFREIIADMDTPVSAFLKLGNETNSFLLESVVGGEQQGRYSFLGSNPYLIITAHGNRVTIEGEEDTILEDVDDPLSVLEEKMAAYRPADIEGLPPFYGGAVGYLGYDAIRYFEQIPQSATNDLDIPEMVFMLTDAIVIFDHLKHKMKVVVNARVNGGDLNELYSSAVEKIDGLIKKLRASIVHTQLVEIARFKTREFSSNITESRFTEMVEKAKKYIYDGDIFQVVLSQRFSTPVTIEPFDIYRVLRTINPSPYMIYLKTGDCVIAGSSPEPLIQVQDGVVLTRPIAGTRPRGKSADEERMLEDDLMGDEKERAEHVMLVDLGRNDIGRVCEPGTVKVDDLMYVERYSHVMHIVSTVTGELAGGKSAYDALRAAFPAGTVSGAPKIRAMEIIDELEPTLRGPYAGVYGYFGFNGNLDCGITIRTIIMKDGQAYVQAGAGIVADSVPQREYIETKNKARALFAAIDQAGYADAAL